MKKIQNKVIILLFLIKYKKSMIDVKSKFNFKYKITQRNQKS